ncbi:MAG: hypothetical protein EA422_07615 [Gemmatimonadales bacterium]|nr:MAG: hypothetical protein EA422_07615 [Gemmatimonadales bacterium]
MTLSLSNHPPRPCENHRTSSSPSPNWASRSSRPGTPWSRSSGPRGSMWRKGRSALDAVELMNAGWNYRREHFDIAIRRPSS